MADALAPSVGLLTWGAEGTEGGRSHSRVLQTPPGASGLTLGRGYDMKERSATKIEADLVAAGVAAAEAKTLGKASGLTGAARQKFIDDNKLDKFEIDEKTQKALFEQVYGEIKVDVVRICDKQDTKEAYGIVDFTTLDPTILDVIVDLTFRGDYTGKSRKVVQSFVATNDLDGLAGVIDDAVFANVPSDRATRRKTFINDAITKAKAAGTMPKPTAAVFPPHIPKPVKKKHAPGHHKAGKHAAHLAFTTVGDHRQLAFVEDYLRYTSLAVDPLARG